MLSAQHVLDIEIQSTDGGIDRSTVTIDSLRTVAYTDSIVNNWKEDGYLNAEVDTIIRSKTRSLAKIYQGYRYDKLQLDLDTKTINLLQEAGMANVRWIGDTYSHQRVLDAMDKIIVYLENNGYPFATVKMDSVVIDKGTIKSKLLVDKKNLVLMDTLAITGEANVSSVFIKRYLDIKAGDPYSLKKILDIKRKVTSLPYCKLKKDPTISFVNKKAVLRLELEKQRASVFDFIIGVLPNNVNGQREFIITGEFKGDLYNELGYGERIFANFERLRPETQELELKFNLPYIGSLPFGIDTDFGLYRNSINFLELKSKFGLQYLFSGLNYIDASWYFNSSRLIEIDTTSLINRKQLPSQLDVNYTGGGVGVFIENVDYRFNPGKGWRTSINSTVGIKSIVLFDNELFRIGGNRLLRGFDEQSILTDFYAIATAEFRVILDQNSFLSFPFIDYGRVNSLRDGNRSWENTIGAGIGLNFATGAGIFNVSFAIGRRDDVPVDFSNAKIHFGYVSLF